MKGASDTIDVPCDVAAGAREVELLDGYGRVEFRVWVEGPSSRVEGLVKRLNEFARWSVAADPLGAELVAARLTGRRIDARKVST